MCGRFAATMPPAVLAEMIHATDETVTGYERAPDYNVAPTASITTVVCRHGEPGDAPIRRVRSMRWGLVPPWAKAESGRAPGAGPLLINARAETVTTAPAFRSSARSRRCLIPMDGFYEWRVGPETPAGKTSGRTPFYIHRGDRGLLFAAGLWSVWKPADRPAPDTPPLLSCAIITTEAVGRLADVHDRMPLLMTEGDWDAWLDPDAPADPALLAHRPDLRGITLHAVSTRVNSVANNGPELTAPAEPPDQGIQGVLY